MRLASCLNKWVYVAKHVSCSESDQEVVMTKIKAEQGLVFLHRSALCCAGVHTFMRKEASIPRCRAN